MAITKLWKPITADDVSFARGFGWLAGKELTVDDFENDATVELEEHQALCELVDTAPLVAMTPQRITMLQSLLALAEVEEPSCGRGDIHAEILAAIKEAKVMLKEVGG